MKAFQTLEFTEVVDALLRSPSVVDGQTSVELKIVSLEAGESLAFITDVDDTIGQREITVSGSEIEGAEISYEKGREISTAAFSSSAQ